MTATSDVRVDRVAPALAELDAYTWESARDSIEDDVEGAHAAGIEHAFLLDREGRFPEAANRLPDLLALPAALGLPPS